MSDSRRGFGLDIGFIDHFNTQLVIILADLHTLQITVTHALVFSVCYCVCWKRLLTVEILQLPRSSSLRMAAPYQLTHFFTDLRTELI
jgi:hypothetical protein